MKRRQAAVFVRERQAGTLRQEPGRFVFEYEAGYLADPAASAVSLTLPKTQRLYVAPTLFPFFVGLLAEGINLSLQARSYHLDERDGFGLLLATAGKPLGRLPLGPCRYELPRLLPPASQNGQCFLPGLRPVAF